MNIKEKFPEFNSALLEIISDNNPILGKNNESRLTYYLKLNNFKVGFDYYEFFLIDDETVCFKIYTMIGLKTYLETYSRRIKISENLGEFQWMDLIYNTSIEHIQKEEYQGLKFGYVKKGQSGCLGPATIILILISSFVYFSF